MRPNELSLRVISTLAPPPTSSKSLSAAPPVLVARNRTKVEGSFLLLSSREPDFRRKAWLGRARQLTRYSLKENKGKTDFSLDINDALRRFSEPALGTNVAQLGAAWNPYIRRKPRLYEMLMACLLTPEGIRGLFEADVVAEREVIKKLMFPLKASFNASFAHGVLFLEEFYGPAESPVDYPKLHRTLGFFRASTEIYTKGWAEPSGRTRHTLHSVVARPLGGLNLLMTGSVDCVKFMYRNNKDPDYYMQFVTRPLRDGKYLIRPKTWKEWYIRAHLMGIRSLYLGLIDEAGVLRNTRRLATGSLPKAAAVRGVSWDPEENIYWGFRVLTALRDFCQEAADLHSVATKQYTARAVWRVEISPIAGETRVLVRKLSTDERTVLQIGRYGLIPDAVIKAYDKGYP
ncbi:hypothetical protein FB451DRAFT_476318 [Mycena latifolia]|nr:hypothetical protein FB451DRAFT_476318 [Mycena latifolia]